MLPCIRIVVDSRIMGSPEGKKESPYRRRLERLAGMMGTDEGFFVLALHSFVEALGGERVPEAQYDELKFGDLCERLAQTLWGKGPEAEAGCHALMRMAREHPRTHDVRHRFDEMGQETATAATHNFLVICRALGIREPTLADLERGLELWSEKTSPLERSAELRRMRLHLTLTERQRDALLTQLKDWETAKARLEHLDTQLGVVRREAEQAKARADAKDQRLDQAREEMNKLRLERKSLLERMEKFAALEAYVRHLDQFTQYTRTRRDYESSVMTLTPEQRGVVQAMDLGHDFLVKGAAGTGKTLVLLHALGRAHQENKEDLNLHPHGAIVLLTYTTTLVKYDRYLAEIMGREGGPEAIVTADAYLFRRLAALESGYKVDFDTAKAFCKARASAAGGVDFLGAEELLIELEEYLLASDISREEYVDNRVLRRGLRQPLSAAQRAVVWKVRDEMIEHMERTKVLSRSYAHWKLVRRLERGGPEVEAVRDADLIFVDESQDLKTIDLKALKLLARRALIMAGDTDQSIYGVGSPYARAGIDISGRTRILHTNFRNTCPIHDLSERYRRAAGEGRHDSSNAPTAFREGPLPELFTSPSADGLVGKLVERVNLFLGTLAYDPENVAVLCPTREEINRVAKALRAAGHECADIREEAFSFQATGAVRLCTLHSSKGLDFPVVLMYLPKLPMVAQYDDKSADKLLRNLVYVGMTRAMDNLNVFCLAEPVDAALRDLVGAWGEGKEL